MQQLEINLSNNFQIIFLIAGIKLATSPAFFVLGL